MKERLLDLNYALGTLVADEPLAYAYISGSRDYPGINGTASFYPIMEGTLAAITVNGLPFYDTQCFQYIFGLHIHEGRLCRGDEEDPFSAAGEHFNPDHCPHPYHAGDLPPLLGNKNGDALQVFYTDRFRPEEIFDRTIIIHLMPDDFHTQPSGNAGVKIACGEIKRNVLLP